MGILDSTFGVVTADIMLRYLGLFLIIWGLIILILLSFLLGIILVLIGIVVDRKVRKRIS
jgi:hypothetical protein